MMNPTRRILAAGAAALSLLAPTAANACAVCFGGTDSDWPAAFFAGTLVMMALPPAILISAGVAIYRATKRQEARRAALAAAAKPAPAVEPMLRPNLRVVRAQAPSS